MPARPTSVWWRGWAEASGKDEPCTESLVLKRTGTGWDSEDPVSINITWIIM